MMSKSSSHNVSFWLLLRKKYHVVSHPTSWSSWTHLETYQSPYFSTLSSMKEFPSRVLSWLDWVFLIRGRFSSWNRSVQYKTERSNLCLSTCELNFPDASEMMNHREWVRQLSSLMLLTSKTEEETSMSRMFFWNANNCFLSLFWTTKFSTTENQKQHTNTRHPWKKDYQRHPLIWEMKAALLVLRNHYRNHVCDEFWWWWHRTVEMLSLMFVTYLVSCCF